MNKNVYVSCSWEHSGALVSTKNALVEQGFKVTSNGKSEKYDSSKIQKAEFVVFVLDEHYSWSIALEDMSSGTLKELVWCVNNRKPIFIMYKTRLTNEIKPYAAEITSDLVIQGKQGTSSNLETLTDIDDTVLINLKEAELAVSLIISMDDAPYSMTTNFY